jgi:RimJ/RimL family protein N-acetyltransferase
LPILSTATKQALLETLQVLPATPYDCHDLWEWRNNPQTRAMSLNTEEIPYDSHCAWYESVLNSQTQFIFIGCAKQALEHAGLNKIGMVRFDLLATTGKRGKEALISINLNPDYRACGLSSPLLEKAISAFKALHFDAGNVNIQQIKAVINVANTASIKCFESVGFIKTESSFLPGNSCDSLNNTENLYTLTVS